MSIEYKITGFSNITEEQVLEVKINDKQDFLKELFGLKPNHQMVDTYVIENEKQKMYFSKKYKIIFLDENEYFVEAYQA
jgi:hypothetical protein